MKLRYALIVCFCIVVFGFAAWAQTENYVRSAGVAPPLRNPVLGETVPLPPCITIDLDPDSRGFALCAKEALIQSKVTPLPNQPTGANPTNLAQAFANLANCSKSRTGMIIGHGDSGYIHVGGGDYFVDDNTKYIGDIQNYGTGTQPWNLPNWSSLTSSIKNKYDTIFLLGCETGANPSGGAFISEFSALTASHVKAPTSKVWCD